MAELDTIRDYYNANVQREWERMDRHPMEFAITSHYIKQYIHPGMRVLDVGGGPGRYSLMLAKMGCDVTLFDLSPANVAFALDKAGEKGLKLAVLVGDACEVDRLVSGSFDVVLNMGPLYHLLTEERRAQSIRACRNVLKEGGVLFASIITLQAGVMYYLQNDMALIGEPGEAAYLHQVNLDESYTGPAFTDAHFMRVWDLCPFMESLGFETLHRVACEGLCCTRESQYLQLPQELQNRWLELSIRTCERPEFLGLSDHLLYVGRRV